MSWNWPRIGRTARRLVSRRHVPLSALASETHQLAPGQTVTIPPAIHLPGALERVRKLSPWRDWATERLLVEGGRLEHAPSLRHRVHNVHLVGAYLYRGAAKEEVGYARESWHAETPCEHLPRAHLMSNFAGSRYFGNYLLDEFPRELLAQDDEPRIRAIGKSFEHESGYRELVGLVSPRHMAWAYIDELLVYSDFAQNEFKEARYRELRARLRGRVPGAKRRGQAVFLDRGETGERRTIDNAGELKSFLLSQGVEIVTPAEISAEDIARQTLDASLVIGVEGSHFSHAIYTAAEQAVFLVLEPPDRFAMAYKEFTDRMGFAYAFLVGHPTEQGWTLPLDELARLLERVRK